MMIQKKRSSWSRLFPAKETPVLLYPHLLVNRPFKKFVWRKMAGIRVILKRWPWPTQSTRAGETALSL